MVDGLCHHNHALLSLPLKASAFLFTSCNLRLTSYHVYLCGTAVVKPWADEQGVKLLLVYVSSTQSRATAVEQEAKIHDGLLYITRRQLDQFCPLLQQLPSLMAQLPGC